MMRTIITLHVLLESLSFKKVQYSLSFYFISEDLITRGSAIVRRHCDGRAETNCPSVETQPPSRLPCPEKTAKPCKHVTKSVPLRADLAFPQ